jgi:predicted  nucleic acid-binding Zn-ribbon protein
MKRKNPVKRAVPMRRTGQIRCPHCEVCTWLTDETQCSISPRTGDRVHQCPKCSNYMLYNPFKDKFKVKEKTL